MLGRRRASHPCVVRSARRSTSHATFFFYTPPRNLALIALQNTPPCLAWAEDRIDLPQEVSGVMPSTEWKLRNFKQKWYAGGTISVGLAREPVAVTPIQLARAIGAMRAAACW